MQSDAVEILVGGFVHAGWQRYDIDSDLMVPADAWSVSLSQLNLAVPATVVEGAPAEVRVGGQTVMLGTLEDKEHVVGDDAHSLTIRGRDRVGILLDCSAAIFSAQNLTLQEIVAKVVRPLGQTKIRVDATSQLQRERVSVEPGDTGWETLRRAAEANGLWPWCEPDGTLVVGGPDYSVPPVDRLVMRKDGKANNIKRATERRSSANRFSEVTVLGQAHATADHEGRNAVKAVVKDTGVTGYRPRVVVDHEAVSVQVATARARKIISDARVKSYELVLELRGHRAANGELWRPGMRVHVEIEEMRIDGVFFVMSRRFTGLPQRTALTLREDGAWVLDAHPSKRRHRRGKNAAAKGAIIDVTGSDQ